MKNSISDETKDVVMERWSIYESKSVVLSRKNGNIEVLQGDNPESKNVAIYVSSHAIYFPNDEKTFIQRIVRQNKYDWQSNRIRNTRLNIYLRDVYKQWYVKGVNDVIDSIDKIIEYIRQLIDENDRLFFIGSSAGAYLSLALCSKMGGVSYAISPQLDLLYYTQATSDDYENAKKKNELVYQYADEIAYNKWYQLYEHIESCKIAEFYFFYGTKNEIDRNQIERLKSNQHIHVIGFDTDSHGGLFYPVCIKKITKKQNRLNSMADACKCGKSYYALNFSFQIAGPLNLIYHYLNLIRRKIKR